MSAPHTTGPAGLLLHRGVRRTIALTGGLLATVLLTQDADDPAPTVAVLAILLGSTVLIAYLLRTLVPRPKAPSIDEVQARAVDAEVERDLLRAAITDALQQLPVDSAARASLADALRDR